MNLDISKTGAIGFVFGGILGGYWGYHRSKQDVKKKYSIMMNS